MKIEPVEMMAPDRSPIMKIIILSFMVGPFFYSYIILKVLETKLKS